MIGSPLRKRALLALADRCRRPRPPRSPFSHSPRRRPPLSSLDHVSYGSLIITTVPSLRRRVSFISLVDGFLPLISVSNLVSATIRPPHSFQIRPKTSHRAFSRPSKSPVALASLPFHARRTCPLRPVDEPQEARARCRILKLEQH